MQLQSLTVTGISTSFRQRRVVLELGDKPPGVYALVGENGAGKTTLMEMMLPGTLYGELPSYRESVISHVPADVRDAFAQLIFRLGGRMYRAERLCDAMFNKGRGKTEAYLWHAPDVQTPEAWQPLGGPQLRAFDEARSKILPSLEVILASTFACQRSAHQTGSFFSSTRAEKRAIFHEMLGVSNYKAMSGRAGLRAEECESQAQMLDDAAESLTSQKAEHERLLVQEERYAHEVSVFTGKALVTQSQIQEARDKREGHVIEATRLQAIADEATRVQRQRTKDLQAAREALEVAQAEKARLAELGRAWVRCDLDWLAGAITQAEFDLAAKEREKDAAQQNLIECGEREKSLQAEKVQNEEKIEYLKDKIAFNKNAANVEGVNLELEMCQKCPLTAHALEAAQSIPALELSLHPLCKARLDLAKLLDGAGAGRRTAERAHNLARDEYGKGLANVQRLKLKQTEAMAQQANAQKLAVMDSVIEERRLTVGRAETDLAAASMASNKYPELAVQRENIERLDAELKRLGERLLEEQAGKEEASNGCALVQSLLVQIGTTWAASEDEDIEAKRAEASLLRRQAEAYRLLERSLGPNGVPALLIDAAGPTVSRYANDLLSECFGPRFQLRLITTRPYRSKAGNEEVFECEILDAETGRTAHQGCGGEMVICEEALRLAVALYLTEHCGFEQKTLFRDECAGACSPRNALKYLAMLRRARELGNFDKVFFVSHYPELWQGADGAWVIRGGEVQYTDEPAAVTL